MEYLAFGPVPSRRLGRSLGVNNIPAKICSYSCVYCQLGPTINLSSDRKALYAVEEIVSAVKERVNQIRARHGVIDYITFVPDGEPTIDINLGREIAELKELGIKIAVITNSSLLWRKDVREDLLLADWVSVKVDTVEQDIWTRLNRPSRDLDLDLILSGIEEFSKEFKGFLATETLLVKGLNDDEYCLRRTSQYIRKLNPAIAYISVPTRPPAEEWANPPEEAIITKAFLIFRNSLTNVELLTGYEGTLFDSTGDVEKDILSIASVHPMRKDAVQELLKKSGYGWSLVDDLMKENKLKEVSYKGNKYYIRKILQEHD